MILGANSLDLRVFPTVDKVGVSSKVSDPVLESTGCKAHVDSSVPVVPIALNQDSLRGRPAGSWSDLWQLYVCGIAQSLPRSQFYVTSVVNIYHLCVQTAQVPLHTHTGCTSPSYLSFIGL